MDLIVLIMLALTAGAAVAVIAIYNRLVAGRNAVEAGWRQIDVQLKRRHDLIPNLVASVKDYMSYERETLEKVVEARSQAMSAVGSGDRGSAIAAEGILGQALGRLSMVTEAYPELRSQANVGQLMEELAGTENKISFARQYYNDSVEAQNNRLGQFPSNVVAGLFGFSHEAYFEIPEEEASQREAPSVSLS